MGFADINNKQIKPRKGLGRGFADINNKQIKPRKGLGRGFADINNKQTNQSISSTPPTLY